MKILADHHGSIDNPLLTFDDTTVRTREGRTELEQYVYQFCEGCGLGDRYELLIFGARLARDKYDAMRRYDNELTESEKRLLEEEKDKKTGFWKQSKFFRATIVTASLGGMIQGWTQRYRALRRHVRWCELLTLALPFSVNSGTAYGMPQEFHLCINMGKNCPSSDLWTFGMLNAVPWFSAGIFGTILADPLQENILGRRGSVMLSCAITIASTIAASTTHTVAELAACRAINGIALGAKASISVSLYFEVLRNLLLTMGSSYLLR